MEGEFVAENLATLDGHVKQDVLAYLNDIQMKQEDVLVLLLAGQNIFIQPYKADYITATLQKSDTPNDNSSHNHSHRDENNLRPDKTNSQKAKHAFLLSHGGKKQ